MSAQPGTRVRLLTRLSLVAATVVCTGLPLAAAAGQHGMRPDTREELRAQLQSLERVVTESAEEDSVDAVMRRISTIRTRLADGDFDPGDVVRLFVRSDTALSGDFRVNSDRMLVLPTIDNVDLDGVLYAEADSVIRNHLGQYLKETNIRIQITRRIAVLGGVQRPGFYDVQPGTTLSEAIMRAGGPTGQAELGSVELRRDGKNLLEDRQASLQQITLADLGPGSDDELFVPQSGGGFGTLGVLGVVSALTGTAYAITRIF